MKIRRAKIVCTIGPTSSDLETLEQLIKAGMDVARLNFSHGNHDQHAKTIEMIRKASASCGKTIAILQDLCGPKIRCAKFPSGTLRIQTNDQIVLRDSADDTTLAEDGEILIKYEGLAEDLMIGDVIKMDDGRITLKVYGIEKEKVLAIVIQGGFLRDRVGVHLPSHRVRLGSITEKDKIDLAFGLEHDVDYIALSFVRSPEDVRAARQLTVDFGKPTPIIAKIETPSAIEHLESIIMDANDVMVARGDLGVEMSPERVPILQREILGLSRIHQRPVIVATEMLQSMVTAIRPTRAEASDVATAVFDGADALMLSQETASGNHPVLVTQMMASIIMETEQSSFYKPLKSERIGTRATVAESVARKGCEVAEEIGAKVIVAFTESGLTARFASKARPNVPIIAFSPYEATRRRLALYWGVVPQAIDRMSDSDHLVNRAQELLIEHGFVSMGDKFVALFGAPVGVSGATNSIRVKMVE